MRANGLRRFLLAAASVLVLSTGVAIADPGNGKGGGNGNGNGGGNGNGNGNGGGNGNNGNGNDGGGGSSSSDAGDSSGGSSSGADGSGSSGGSSGADSSSSSGGSSSASGSGFRVSGGASVSSLAPGGDSGAPLSAAEPAFRSDPIPYLLVPERDPTFSAADLVASLPPLGRWTLADYSGRRVIDPSGSGIGTVEGLMVDPANNLYLITALDSQDVDGHERLIPLSRFKVHPPSQTLMLDQEAFAVLPAMADMTAVASVFMMVATDAQLRSLTSLP